MSQRWLITGISRGLGWAMASAVLEAGHQLAATARDAADLQDLVDREELAQWRELSVACGFPA